jgi:UDPglucose--hexose-1-phosphate uridylyltransferase
VKKLQEIPHKRYNPLTGEWVLVSPHRNNRPWQGQIEKSEDIIRPEYDEICYLCPGNKRSNGKENSNYKDVYSFENDFSALLPTIDNFEIDENNLLLAKAEKGICKVICFSPRHDLTVPEMEIDEIEKVVKLWMNEYLEISKNTEINYIQIFENKGAIMGCSNPHPHGQIWASSTLPNEIIKKHFQQKKYFEQNNKTILQDYIELEISKNERIVYENNSFIVLVPFWAIWPFETVIVPKRKMSRITEMNDDEIKDFSDAYQKITIIYDNIFNTSFPYSAGIHQAPSDHLNYEEWHWHFSFYPPLLRSSTIKKFMVGYEMFATPQRDISPEKAAEILKNQPLIHYKKDSLFF